MDKELISQLLFGPTGKEGIDAMTKIKAIREAIKALKDAEASDEIGELVTELNRVIKDMI